MTREQAINYLFSCGFTNEQVCDVVRALTYEPTTKNDSKFCPDRKAKTTHAEGFLHCIENDCVAYKNGKCLKYNSDQEPTTKNDSSELEKNSKKLEKDFGELDCISRADARSLICNIDIKHGMHGMSRKVFKDLYNGMDELPSVTPQLSVPEVTALAEWTEKLTKECEDAYNKGYADGMKAQAEPKTKIEESNFSREQYALDIDTAWKCGYEAGKKENAPVNICPHCGEYIGEEE